MSVHERFAGKLAGLRPDARRQLDGLPAEELLARLLYVEHLDKAASTCDAATARGYADLASGVLGAPPWHEKPAVPEAFVRAAKERIATEAAATRRIVKVTRPSHHIDADGSVVIHKRADVVAKAVAEATKAADARIRALEAALAKVSGTPIPGGPVLARPAGAGGSQGRSTALAKAADFERRANEMRGVDPAAARGYEELARAERAKATGSGGR